MYTQRGQRSALHPCIAMSVLCMKVYHTTKVIIYNASKGTLQARADTRRECRPYGDRARGNAPANFAFKQNVSFCFRGSQTRA